MNRPIATLKFALSGLLRFSAPLLIALFLANIGQIASARKIGAEFQINAAQFEAGADSSIVALKDGGFVVTWTDRDGGGLAAIKARRYGANGAPVGDGFLVNTSTSEDNSSSSVAVLDDGGFVIVWSVSLSDIRGRRYGADGAPVGDEFPVNATTEKNWTSPSVTGLDDGGFVVVWMAQIDTNHFDIRGQRFMASGARTGDEFQANTSDTVGGVEASPHTPSVARLGSGGFVVVWNSDPCAGVVNTSYPMVCVRRYRASGQPIGAEVSIGLGAAPVVAHLKSGGAVVLWTEISENTGVHISAQRLARNGTRSGSAFLATTGGSGWNSLIEGEFHPNSSFAELSSGSYVVTWDPNRDNAFGLDVHSQRLRRDGTFVGTDTAVTQRIFDQVSPVVAGLADGSYVIVWGTKPRNQHLWNLIGQRFSVP